MNLAFVDAIGCDYDPGSTLDRPLGGSQSALCYLAVALAARGHRVASYTATTKPRIHQGVQCNSYRDLGCDALANCDAVIVLNGPAHICLAIRPKLPPSCRLILWTQHAQDQSAMSELQRPEVRAGWNAIVCVSQWQLAGMQRRFGLDSSRTVVLRNAVGPAFLNLFPDAAALAKAKSSAPIFAYTSTPFRGLNLLLAIFPAVHRCDNRVRLRVYSSMKVYANEESNDPYASLYANCRSTPGVDYIGSIPQPALAESLKSGLILTYPNTFAETSCIAIMEAMAAGLLVVTSDLGALPETTMGMGVLIPGPGGRADHPAFIQAYADRLMACMQTYAADPRQFWAARWEQVRTVTTRCTWLIRAAEWEQFLQRQPLA